MIWYYTASEDIKAGDAVAVEGTNISPIKSWFAVRAPLILQAAEDIPKGAIAEYEDIAGRLRVTTKEQQCK